MLIRFLKIAFLINSKYRIIKLRYQVENMKCIANTVFHPIFQSHTRKLYVLVIFMIMKINQVIDVGKTTLTLSKRMEV